MTEEERLGSLEVARQRATLTEFEFTPARFGRFGAWLRRMWNGVAARWYVRPIMARQTLFNHTLVDAFEQRPPGHLELEGPRLDDDRALVGLGRELGTAALRVRLLEARLLASHRDGGLRPRLAYFSPLPPSRSGIADYSAELLPHLAERADLTLFAENNYRGEGRYAGLVVRPVADFAAHRSEYDLPLYQMGNSDQHEMLYEYLLRYPGVVVLHDYYLHHFIRHHTLGRWDAPGYAREMSYALGPEGRGMARAVRDGATPAPLFTIPLNRRLIDTSLGLIVHSRFAAERIRRQRPEAPLAIVPAPVEMRDGRSRRSELDLPPDAVLFGSFGQITPEKQIDLALRVFSRVHADHPNSRYLLVGEPQPDVAVHRLIAELGLTDAVRLVGFVPDLATFVDWIHSVDVVVNLRYPTVGETSAIALRAMAAARPSIVFDHGWYGELPEATAVKVPPLDEAALQGAMEHLVASQSMREAVGLAAQEYVRRYCLPQHVAGAYLDFLHSIISPVAEPHV